MSRRPPNPAAERAAQNQAAIKNLLKLEANKTCADCKRNKHPRWASWNLGIFICIRCSGIHRGMGTHISRVKSVDLDSWTDEQLQSVVKWGNARANKYWEAKLAAGHAPSEGKIENFIRTKYELKRWVMDGAMPDPSTLDDDDDDDDKNDLKNHNHNVSAGSAARKASVGQRHPGPAAAAAPALDLIGGPDPLPQQRTGPPAARIPAKAEPAPPKATGTKDSLLGLDFFGSGSAPQRPASTTGVNAGGSSRPDLKQSILSLYASAPKSQPPPQQHQQQGGFGGMGHHHQHQHSGSVGGGVGLNDAFGNLSMGSPVSPGKPPAAADPFASLGSTARTSSSSQSRNSLGGLSGGSFFDAKPAAPPQQQQQQHHHHQSRPSNSGFGAFSPPPQAPAKPSSAMNDLFDFSSPTTATATATTPGSHTTFQSASQTSPSAQTSSAFHLSSPPAHPAAPTSRSITSPSALGGANLSGADVWGGGSDWTLGTGGAATTTTTTTTVPSSGIVPPAKKAELPKTAGLGWASSGAFAATPIVPGSAGGFNPAPKVAADEEFGGWTSSAGPSSGVAATTTKAFGEDGNDLFGNVWQ